MLAGHTDIDAVVAHPHVDRPQAIFGIAAVAAGFDVELPAVPGTHDVALVGEPQAAHGLIGSGLLFPAADPLALAPRAPGVRAGILVGDDAVALSEHAEL